MLPCLKTKVSLVEVATPVCPTGRSVIAALAVQASEDYHFLLWRTCDAKEKGKRTKSEYTIKDRDL